MSRWLGWLSELQPELFCEVSPELARERGLEHGGWATLSSARGRIEARVLVTRRMRPLQIRGRTIHQIGIPYHFGSMGLVRGDSTNDLLSVVNDPNVNIPESKVLTGDIRPGRKSQQVPEKPVAIQEAARDRADVGHEHKRPTQMDSKS
jgi:formate dehydrogenase major subunit